MNTKEPGYNGYEERFLNGAGLKTLFKGQIFHYWSPPDVQLEKNCPICRAFMKFRQGKYGAFLGCSRYPNCKKTIRIPIINNA